MRLFIATLLLLFFGSLRSLAQDSSVISKASFSGWLPLDFSLTHFIVTQKNEAGVSFGAWESSNAINLSFNSSLLRNEFISDDQKQTVTDQLQKNNVVEDGFDFRIYGSWLKDSFLFKSPALLGVDFSAGNFTSIQFTDQLFNAVFYGNAYYAGQTADFSGSKEYNYEYDRIGFSLQKNFQSPKSLWQVGAKLSLISIHSAAHSNIEQGSLYTEQNGEYLYATYNFEFTSSDSSNPGSLQSDGIGLTADLMTSWMSATHHSRVSFYVNNLGFTSWNKNSLTYSADSSVHFEGVEVNNFLSHDDGPLFQYNKDSIIKYTGTKVESGSRTFGLPVAFSIIYEQSLTRKMVLQSGISYRPYPDLYPLVFVKPKWIISPAFEVAAIASAGGTARYALGVEMAAVVMHHWKIVSGSDNVLGIFMPDQTTSASLFLQLSYQF